MLPIKKIYVDSRHKTVDSESDSNFIYELPVSLHMPQNACFYITDVCIPHVWRTINKDFNDKIYFGVSTELGYPVGRVELHDYIGILDPGDYTESELVNKIHSIVHAADNALTATINGTTGEVSITVTGIGKHFKIYTDHEIKNKLVMQKQPQKSDGVIMTTDTSDPQSINEILQNTKERSQLYDGLRPDYPNTINNVMKKPRLLLQRVNNVYITIPNFGSFDTISAFSNNVVMKVPVLASYGFMIVDQIVSTADFLNCGGQTLKTLEFHLRDGLGNYIPLLGHLVTFSIVFDLIREK